MQVFAYCSIKLNHNRLICNKSDDYVYDYLVGIQNNFIKVLNNSFSLVRKKYMIMGNTLYIITINDMLCVCIVIKSKLTLFIIIIFHLVTIKIH